MRAKKKVRIATYSIVAFFSLASVLTAGWKDRLAAAEKKPAAGKTESRSSGLQGQVKYPFVSYIQSLYPDQSWLPDPYKKYYPKLEDTIKMFTEQSLKNDGIPYDSVSVAAGFVTIQSSDPRAKYYADVHPAFWQIGGKGQVGARFCMTTKGCWDPKPDPKQPWAFFLPLGLPMVNQKAVLFLDYPPAVSLRDRDYYKNETMRRWSYVLRDLGIREPVLYETIVDARPIAAPGSGQTRFMPDPTKYFNTPPDRSYITPMLILLTNTPTNTSTSSLPVAVLGEPAREAWSQIINKPAPQPLDVGIVTLPGANKPTPWVAGNHPIKTDYQCCPGDPNKKCYNENKNEWSYDLIPDEKIDLQVACIIKTLGANPAADPNRVKAQCAKDWDTHPSPDNQAKICLRARLDYTRGSEGHCGSFDEAKRFCNYYKNNACPTDVFACKVPSKTTSVPVKKN